jgi:hypothetical protein
LGYFTQHLDFVAAWPPVHRRISGIIYANAGGDVASETPVQDNSILSL